MTDESKIRQAIVTIAGHVDHGKTSILDCFRGSSLQEKEAGGITQKISFTRYPYEQVLKTCPLIEKQGIKIDLPGFLFIDTPGHAAFTNLRKRGGSLADLAILVVSIKEGIKPQTAEVLQILKANKTPFLIALNKLDSISGWRKQGEKLKESIEMQPIHTNQEYEEAWMTFQSSLQEHGFDSDIYYNVTDFTKKVALVPCSARTKEGIPELLLVLCGLCQKFLKEKLKVGNEARGVILEVKKDKNKEHIESILYDGSIEIGKEIAIASFDDVITTKVRALEEIEPLGTKYFPTSNAHAATGVRMHLTNKDGILSGMPFQEIKGNLSEITKRFKKEISESIKVDTEGIIAKADSLGSLEALLFLLRQAGIKVIKADIGIINKRDVISAKASFEKSELDAIVVGFNVGVEEDLEPGKIKIITNDVVYKLIEDLQEWRTKRQAAIEKEKLMGLATICKLQVLDKFVFRNSNPAIFGVKVMAGKLKVGIPLIDDKGEEVARVKSIQLDKASVESAVEGNELAMALPGTTFDRRLKEVSYLYANVSERQFKEFKKNKDLLTANELKVLQEISDMKRKDNAMWGM